MGAELTIADRVRALVSDELVGDVSKCTDDATLAGDLDADSLDVVEIVMATEEEFGVQITDDEANSLVTVGDVVRLVEAKTVDRAAA